MDSMQLKINFIRDLFDLISMTISSTNPASFFFCFKNAIDVSL